MPGKFPSRNYIIPEAIICGMEWGNYKKFFPFSLSLLPNVGKKKVEIEDIPRVKTFKK